MTVLESISSVGPGVLTMTWTIELIRSDLVPLGYMHEGRWQHIANTYIA